MMEYVDKQGNIIRVKMTDGILRISVSSVRYINKTLTEEKIIKIYNNYKDKIIERRKRYISKTGRLCTLINLTILPYNKFRQILIEDYQLVGIPYYKNYYRQKLKMIKKIEEIPLVGIIYTKTGK